jgi:hypothetical protein
MLRIPRRERELRRGGNGTDREGGARVADHRAGDQARCPGLPARGPPSPPRLDQARDRAVRREHSRRPDQDEGCLGCRECPPAPPARGPRSSGQAARARPRRPPAARPPGAPGPRLAHSAAHRAAGDLAALASPRLPPDLARPVARHIEAPANLGGDGRGDPAPGGGESAVGGPSGSAASCSSWASG